MMDPRFSSMKAMMAGSVPDASIVPTQSFAAQNILGTPSPAVGDAQARPNYSSKVGQNVNPTHVVLVAVALIGVGYVVYHVNFEK
jgi:hypothetical protein